VNTSVAKEWWRSDEATAAQTEEGYVPLWGLLLFTIVVVLSPQELFPVLAPLRMAFVASILAVLALLVSGFRGASIIPRYRGVYLLGALVAWAVITVPFSLWPGASVHFLLDAYFKTLVVFWLVTATVSSVGNLRKVAWALTLMMVPLAVVAVRNYLSGAYIEGTSDAELPRILVYQAILANDPNALALMLNLILPLSVGLLFGETNRTRRMVLIGIVIIAVWAIIATFSRGGFVTLAVTALIYLWKLRRRPQRAWILAAIVVSFMAIPLVPGEYWERLRTILDYQEDPTGSAQARWAGTVAAFQFMTQHPLFGAGLGLDALALDEIMGRNALNVHNVFLQYGVDLGLPGLALFVMLVIDTIRSASWAYRRSAGIPSLRGLSSIAEGIQISLFAFVVGSQFLPVAFQIHYYYIAGLALAVKGIAESEIAKASSPELAPLPNG
jgi:putative inorganic carbon (HCO3(-)) transporter